MAIAEWRVARAAVDVAFDIQGAAGSAVEPFTFSSLYLTRPCAPRGAPGAALAPSRPGLSARRGAPVDAGGAVHGGARAGRRLRDLPPRRRPPAPLGVLPRPRPAPRASSRAPRAATGAGVSGRGARGAQRGGARGAGAGGRRRGRGRRGGGRRGGGRGGAGGAVARGAAGAWGGRGRACAPGACGGAGGGAQGAQDAGVESVVGEVPLALLWLHAQPRGAVTERLWGAGAGGLCGTKNLHSWRLRAPPRPPRCRRSPPRYGEEASRAAS